MNEENAEQSPELPDDAPAQSSLREGTTNEQPNNPLHGVKLVDILEYLVDRYGWQDLGDRIYIRCFNSDPSIQSSLKFLRKTQWARDKVERLYLQSIDRPPKR